MGDVHFVVVIYLIKVFDPTFFKLEDPDGFYRFEVWQTTEQRVRGWVFHNRSKTVVGRRVILNLFSLDSESAIHNIQDVDRITLNYLDKIVLWSEDGRYYVMQVVKKTEEEFDREMEKLSKLHKQHKVKPVSSDEDEE